MKGSSFHCGKFSYLGLLWESLLDDAIEVNTYSSKKHFRRLCVGAGYLLVITQSANDL